MSKPNGKSCPWLIERRCRDSLRRSRKRTGSRCRWMRKKLVCVDGLLFCFIHLSASFDVSVSILGQRRFGCCLGRWSTWYSCLAPFCLCPCCPWYDTRYPPHVCAHTHTTRQPTTSHSAHMVLEPPSARLVKVSKSSCSRWVSSALLV